MTKQDIDSRKDLFTRAIKGRAGVFSLLAKSLFELVRVLKDTGAKLWLKKIESSL